MNGGDDLITRLDARTDVPDQPADPTAGRRSFSRGVGFLMQGLGATLFILTTCACCGIAFFEGGAMHRGVIDVQAEASGGAARTQVFLVASVIGSLSLVAFGLGQQSDRGRLPAWGTAATVSLMAAAYFTVPLLNLGPQSRPGLIMAVSIALAVLFALSAVAAWLAVVQVMRHPPLSAAPPTVPADAFPDPLAQPRERHDSPAEADLARRRKRLEEELRRLDMVERQVRREDRRSE